MSSYTLFIFLVNVVIYVGECSRQVPYIARMQHLALSPNSLSINVVHGSLNQFIIPISYSATSSLSL